MNIPDSTDAPDIASPGRTGMQLGVMGVVGILLCALVYLVSVRTELGQTFGDAAYRGRHAEGSTALAVSRDILAMIRYGSVIAMVFVLLAAGILRRNLVTSAVVGAGFVGAIITAEILKRELYRPVLSPLEATIDKGGLNTYPSGHSTIATAFILALLLVVAPRARVWVALGGAVWVSLVCTSTLAAGWHRPSDAIGGIALAVGFLGLAGAVLVSRHHILAFPTAPSRYLLFIGLGVWLLATIEVFASLAGNSSAKALDPRTMLAFPLASSLISAAAVTAVCGFAWILCSGSGRGRHTLFESSVVKT